MKLDWRMSSDGERVFCRIPDGCLFVDIPPRGKPFIHILATDATVGGALPRSWAGREFDTPEAAQEAIEQFYFQGKEFTDGTQTQEKHNA